MLCRFDTAVPFYRSAFDLLTSGQIMWKDVSREDRGHIFDMVFVRGVKRIYMLALFEVGRRRPHYRPLLRTNAVKLFHRHSLRAGNSTRRISLMKYCNWQMKSLQRSRRIHRNRVITMIPASSVRSGVTPLEMLIRMVFIRFDIYYVE